MTEELRNRFVDRNEEVDFICILNMRTALAILAERKLNLSHFTRGFFQILYAFDLLDKSDKLYYYGKFNYETRTRDKEFSYHKINELCTVDEALK